MALRDFCFLFFFCLVFSFRSDWSLQDGSGSVNPFSPLAAPPQPIGAPGPFSQSNIPLPHAMVLF